MKSRSVFAACSIILSASASALTFTWTNLAGGSMGTGANWSSAPTFVNDDVLDFTTLNITAGRTVTLDGNRTAGTLKFGDATTASNDWTVSTGTPTTSKFTLTTTSGTPIINVLNQTTNIGVIIDGTQGFEKTGAGNISLSASNIYTGTSTLTSGVVFLQNPSGFGSEVDGTTLAAGSQVYFLTGSHVSLIAEPFTVAGAATFRAGNGLSYTLGGTVTLNATATFLLDSNATITQNGNFGVIEGSADIIKSGTGTLVFSGINTYSGATTINAGTLKLQWNDVLPSYGNITVNSGGTFAVSTGDGSSGWSQAQIDTLRATSGFNLTSGSFLGFDTGANGDFDYSTSLTGSPTHGIAKLGAEALTLSGINSYTGGTLVGGGTLNVNSATSIGTGTVTFTTTTGASIANIGASPVSIANNLAGSNITFSGSGDLTTSGTATYDSANRSMYVTGSGKLTVGSIAASASAIMVKQGTGTLAITGPAGTNVNGVDIRAGTLIVGNKASLGANAFRFDNTAGGVLQTSSSLTGSNKVANAVTMNVAGTISGASDLELGGVISGSGALTKSGNGTLKISGGANTFTAVTVSAGSLNLSNQLAAQSTTVTMAGGNLAFDSSVVGNAFNVGGLSSASAGAGYDVALQNNAGSPAPIALTVGANNVGGTYVGVLSGAGSLIKAGTGNVGLSGANTFTGGTTMKAGILSVNSSNAFGTGDVTQGASGSAAQIWLNNGVNIANKLIMNTNNGISGNGILRVDALNGAATWSGPIEINAVPTSGSNFMTANNATLTIAGYITATPGLTNIGQRDGNVIYSGGGNYTNFILYQGGAKIGANNGMSATALMTLAFSGAAMLDLNGFNQQYDGLLKSTNSATVTNSAATASVLTLGAGTDRTYAGVISNGTGGISLVKQGSSILTLSGLNTYAGNTTVTAGTLVVTNNNVLSDTAVVSLYNSAALNLTNSGTDIVGGLIIGGITQPNGLYTFGTGKLQVVAAVTDYNTWVTSYSLQNPWLGVDPALNGESTADPDHDGLSNLNEYAFGLSPISGASINPIVVLLNKVTGVFTYQRRSTTGFTYKVWTSTDLSSWTLDTGASVPVVTPVGSNENVEFTLTGSKPLATLSLFVRVTAE